MNATKAQRAAARMIVKDVDVNDAADVLIDADPAYAGRLALAIGKKLAESAVEAADEKMRDDPIGAVFNTLARGLRR